MNDEPYMALTGTMNGELVEYRIGGEHDGWFLRKDADGQLQRWRLATAEEGETIRKSFWQEQRPEGSGSPAEAG